MIRILHTSDWHLGQSFMSKSRQAEHEAFLGWLVELIKKSDIDALVVSGDIFDTGSPPSYARKLYFDFLRELTSLKTQVVIIGGNHDSISTLNESGKLLDLLNINVIGGMSDPADETILIKNKSKYPVGIICAVPYLRDRDVRLSTEGENVELKSEALRRGIRQHYQDVYETAAEMARKLNLKLPVIATGHMTTTGGEITEGVRDLYIGSLESFNGDDFPDGFDYIALGHLHKRQTFGVRQHICYCGSPLPLSFIEANYDKSVLIVEIERGQQPQVEEITVPRWQQLMSLQGNLEEIAALMKLTDFDNKQKTWLEIDIDEPGYVNDLQSKLTEIISDYPVEILRVRRLRRQTVLGSQTDSEETLQDLQVEDVFERRLEQEENLDDRQRQNLRLAFKEVCEAVHVESGR